MTEREEREMMLEALRAVASGTTREMGRDSCDRPYAHIRMASLEQVLAVLEKIDRIKEPPL